ncbi:glutamate 5-kinase [Rickettsiales bacterium]|jgi:glutamate 5-kinase|nr:glutamate 5-kinase [Rickettsiales bacterium]
MSHKSLSREIIIIKIGSSLLINNSNIRDNWLDSLAKDIILFSNKYHFIIVTSGAVALGCDKLSYKQRDISIEKKQAMASIGQIYLINSYCDIFANNNLITSQILLSYSDCKSINRKRNFQNTIKQLLDLNIIPIINENDSVAYDEIKIGDNDTLSAYIAQMTNARLLILLSDVDGFYSEDPSINKNAKPIRFVKEIDDNIKKMASGSISNCGTGGMITKINAAKIIEGSNCSTIVTSGLDNNCLSLLLKNKINYTIFNKRYENL